MKVFKLLIPAVLLVLFSGQVAKADAVPGDVTVTLGADLTDTQKQQILNEMGVQPGYSNIITVTNQEEHDYLGKYMSNAQIGTKSFSSTKITLGETNYGLHVQTNNINWVTEDMYKNALMTAGVKDADIYVTAPFPVSGTAALTGLLKAYETSTNTIIPEAQKDVANQELVQTAQLGDKVGDKQAIDLMNLIKLKMAQEKPKTDADVKNIIQQSADQLHIQLTNDELNGLVSLFDKMKSLNIDWNSIGNQLQSAKEQFSKFINDPSTQTWIHKIGVFFKQLVDAIISLFS